MSYLFFYSYLVKCKAPRTTSGVDAIEIKFILYYIKLYIYVCTAWECMTIKKSPPYLYIFLYTAC